MSDRRSSPASQPSVDTQGAHDRRVALVVVTYNSRPLLPEFFAALPAALHEVEATVVVADNASTDGTVAAARDLAPTAAVVETGGNLGYAGAFNRAVRTVAGADAYMILNPDIRLHPGSVAQLLRTLAESDAGIVVPRMLTDDGRLSWSLRHEPSVARIWAEALLGGGRAARRGLSEVISDPARYEQQASVPWATGAVMLMSRECLDTVGPWDDSFFLYSEESDFALRAGDAGYEVRYDPAATAVHIGGDAPTSPHLWSLLQVNRVRLFRKRHGRAATVAFFLGALLNALLRSVGAGSARHRAAAVALLRYAANPSAPVRRP